MRRAREPCAKEPSATHAGGADFDTRTNAGLGSERQRRARGDSLPRRLLPILLAGLLLVAASPARAATTTQLNLITNSSPGHSLSFGQFDSDTYAVADFDHDGKREVVVSNDNQDLYVLSGSSSRVLAEIHPDYPAGWPVRTISDPVVADIDGDGHLDIVSDDSAGVVCAFRYDSGTSTTSMTFTKMWCHRMSDYMGDQTGADAGVAVGDVDGSGKLVTFSNTEDKGLYAFNSDGSVRWKSADYGGNAGPLLTDLDGDGHKEIVFWGDGGEVRVRDASTGTPKWTFYSNKYVTPASISVSGSAADLDGDGKKELVYMARDAHDATNFSNDHAALFVLGYNGALKWWVHPSWTNPTSYNHPVLADVNGDGKKEIITLDWNTIGHKPGNWEVTGSPHLFSYSWDGRLLWKDDIADPWSNDDVALADVTGDGVQDVLAIGTANGHDGVWYVNSRTGAFEQHVDTAYGALRGPVIGDFDGSGKLSWALSIHSSSAGGGFQFFKTDQPCQGLFLSFHENDNCGGSGTPPPPPPPPPPGGSFSATFTPTGANEWWIQVHVTTGNALSGVDARVNGGTWQPLTLQSWGDWAASYHAASGSTVEFRATDTGGNTAQSGCYLWTSMAATTCGGSPPPPTFAATFSNVRGNEWWEETDVSVTGSTLAGVDVAINGGAWTALDHQSYGSWAKSLHAPAGSTVQFRARSTDGQTATSTTYHWPPA